ncbi:hypothetical protein GCM10010911_16870 [Paenibacillus nasutitermitis]|uniref:Uncharacterized protein n=1 Tax=Paenibacillus nasutitermitis TaxID=1652958 RepID=A0A916YT39_9BACL|nr:hypothetical protein GCM10010911_16870 [Paenibacillus nasutitermitis]
MTDHYDPLRFTAGQCGRLPFKTAMFEFNGNKMFLTEFGYSFKAPIIPQRNFYHEEEEPL